MIRINRNHPSIIVWSMDNEVFSPRVRRCPRCGTSQTVVALSHELDSRDPRPSAAASADIDKLGDIAGYNGDGARLFINPGIPNVVSEYGSTVADRPGNYEPGWGDLQTEQFRGAAARRSGALLITAASPAISGAWHGGYFRLPKPSGIGIATKYRHIPRRRPSPARPPTAIDGGQMTSRALRHGRRTTHRPQS